MNHETVTSIPGAVPQARTQLRELRQKVLYGLPCGNCRAYYPSDLAICPLCRCAEKISPQSTLTRREALF